MGRDIGVSGAGNFCNWDVEREEAAGEGETRQRRMGRRGWSCSLWFFAGNKLVKFCEEKELEAGRRKDFRKKPKAVKGGCDRWHVSVKRKKQHQMLDIKLERGVNHSGMKERMVYRISKCINEERVSNYRILILVTSFHPKISLYPSLFVRQHI